MKDYKEYVGKYVYSNNFKDLLEIKHVYESGYFRFLTFSRNQSSAGSIAKARLMMDSNTKLEYFIKNNLIFERIKSDKDRCIRRYE